MGQYGQFEDMYQNTVSVYASSNVEGGIWLRIKEYNGGQAGGAAHLSVNDAKVLISLLHKAVAHQMEGE